MYNRLAIFKKAFRAFVGVIKNTSVGPAFGPLPTGCRLCARGAKLVLFVTGICGSRCFYCPLSFKRRGRDRPWANERLISKNADLLLEARNMKALGAGVTGGEPLLRLERTINYVKLLKSRFGKGFHVHLYTRMGTAQALKKLREAGVDEIRFHFAPISTIREAARLDWDVGIEIPAIPGKIATAKAYIRSAKEAGAKFCNINELDFSEGNLAAFGKRGYSAKNRTSYGAKGSEETALGLLEYCAKIGMRAHYCPSFVKDRVQLRRRFIRTAKNIGKPYESVTRDGLLVKGVILGASKKSILSKFRPNPKFLLEKCGIVETSPKIARMLASKGYRCRIVREHPTCERLVVESYDL